MTSMQPPEDSAPFGRPLNRRRLFELGGATFGLGALLAACKKADPPAAGRVGNAPIATDLPAVTVDDAVYLRTMSSLEYSIIDIYAGLAGIDGLAEKTAAALTRFSDDHTANAARLSELTTEAGGEPYECANPWMMERMFQPALDNITGSSGQEGSSDIPPSDDPPRDALALINALETVAAATYQQMVEKLSTPAVRAAVIPFGAQAARHSAAASLIAHAAPEGIVSPALAGEDIVPDDEGFVPAYAIPSRFGQLTPIEVQVGARNDLGLRYSINFETPADNAYRYADQTCPA